MSIEQWLNDSEKGRTKVLG